MRDPNRLDEFYDKLKELHKKYCPDWRMTQLICNLQCAYGSDLFYLEEDRLIKYVENYFKSMSGE